MGLGIQGEWTGFLFNGRHSSEFGLTRITSNNRYTANMTPTFSDKVVSVSGANETYYFGSNYQKQTFTIDVAFDDLNAGQFQQIKSWLAADQGIHNLSFDEDISYMADPIESSTYLKTYRVKIASAPQFKYLTFNKKNNYGIEETIYKGEATINFVAYFPFAIGPQVSVNCSSTALTFNNLGDVPSDFKLTVTLATGTSYTLSTASNNAGDRLVITNNLGQGPLTFIYDSAKQLLTTTIGNQVRYSNDCLSGTEFKIPTGVDQHLYQSSIHATTLTFYPLYY